MTKFFIIAGEPSGDLHGSRLITKIKSHLPDATFIGMGGDKMQVAGCKLVRHISDMAFMGIVAVVKNLNKVQENFRIAKSTLINEQPDVLVLIDYPTFNLKIAAFCKKHLPNTKIVYYIPPKVWAWKTWRVHTIGKLCDRILCIFPFEVDFYKRYGYTAEYIGNPTLEEIDEYLENKEQRTKSKEQGAKSKEQRTRNKEQGLNGVNTEYSDYSDCSDHSEHLEYSYSPYIALLPGSRRHEIEQCLPRMLKAALLQDGYKVIVAGISAIDEHIYLNAIDVLDELEQKRVTLVKDRTYDIVSKASAAIVNSGTATLETALLNCPQVAVYHLNIGPLLYRLKPLLFKIPYFTLVNIISNKEVIKERLAYHFTVTNVANDLTDILNNTDTKAHILQDYTHLRKLLEQ